MINFPCDLATTMKRPPKGALLPDNDRFLLFEEKREVELVWKGKTNEV